VRMQVYTCHIFQFIQAYTHSRLEKMHARTHDASAVVLARARLQKGRTASDLAEPSIESPPKAMAVVSMTGATARLEATGTASEVKEKRDQSNVYRSNCQVSLRTEALPMPPAPWPPCTTILKPDNHAAWKPRGLGASDVGMICVQNDCVRASKPA
jgi:hypothetical protein